MGGTSRSVLRRWGLATFVAITTLLLTLLGLGTPASADAKGCPRPDKASNVVILPADQSTITLPGSRSADFCGVRPDFAKTRLWTSNTTRAQTLEVPGVGTWTALPGGRLSFTVDASYRERPRGDKSPGRDAIMKFSVVDAKGHYQAAIAVVYVRYPGAGAFSDRIDLCSGARSVNVLTNDAPGWRGTTNANKQHATFRTDTLRLAGAGTGDRLKTEQGTWSVGGQGVVRFRPAKGWSGSTPALRYSVRDTFDNTASSTIVATTCRPRGASNASTDQGSATSSLQARTVSSSASVARPDARTWIPLGLAVLCLVMGGLVLQRRRGGESSSS